MRIRLVGREKEGVLLIARLGYDPVRPQGPAIVSTERLVYVPVLPCALRS